MQRIKNILITGTGERPMALDLFFTDEPAKRPVLIYVHGFNGFKDWGNFDIVATAIAAQGFVVVKFNFSHNGTTPEHPEEFVDLEAFGNNNYTRELAELRLVIDWVCRPSGDYRHVIDCREVYLIGHSLGGGICMLEAAEDKRVKKLVTWAGVNKCKTPWGEWPADKMQEWEHSGVQYYTNGRTGQQMPLYYQLYEDYLHNKERFDIQAAVRKLSIPFLICHGTKDTAVNVEKAFELKAWQPSAQLFTVESDHVFGRKHPWTEPGFPPAMEAVLEATLAFLKNGYL